MADTETINNLLEKIPAQLAAEMQQWYIQLYKATQRGDKDEATRISGCQPSAPDNLSLQQLIAYSQLCGEYLKGIVALEAEKKNKSMGTEACCGRCGKRMM
jgi:hypothetical protein